MPAPAPTTKVPTPACSRLDSVAPAPAPNPSQSSTTLPRRPPPTSPMRGARPGARWPAQQARSGKGTRGQTTSGRWSRAWGSERRCAREQGVGVQATWHPSARGLRRNGDETRRPPHHLLLFLQCPWHQRPGTGMLYLCASSSLDSLPPHLQELRHRRRRCLAMAIIDDRWAAADGDASMVLVVTGSGGEGNWRSGSAQQEAGKEVRCILYLSMWSQDETFVRRLYAFLGTRFLILTTLRG